MKYERELQEALNAAAAAGRFAKAEYEKFTPIPDAPASISTHVDREAQELILRHLLAAFPGDGLIAEEATPTLADSPVDAARVWIVDPIDGTRGFAMKNGEFSVMIGLTVGGRPVLGVVLEPILDRVTYAASGHGCWVRTGTGEPTRCHVTTQDNVAASVWVQSRTKPGRGPKAIVTAIGPAKVVETYSAGIKLAMVARGEVDLYVNDYANFHDWDVCAGHVLVEEAGGKLTEFAGETVIYGAKGTTPRLGMIATNGHLHAEVIRRLKTAGLAGA